MIILLGSAREATSQGRDDAPSCALRLGRVVSMQGAVEIKRTQRGGWARVTHLDTPLCDGDLLRVGANGRAAVALVPETLMRVDQGSVFSIRQVAGNLQVEMFLTEHVPDEVLGNACGAGYFITRFPRGLKVRTPYLNAAVEGTEFQMALACNLASLSVFEGRVSAQSALEASASQVVDAGQGIAAGGSPETRSLRVVVPSGDAVQWALHFPRLSDGGADRLRHTCDSATDRTACHVERAEALLQVGRALEAQAELAAAKGVQTGSADILALESIIALANGNSTQAQRLATRALALSADSDRAHLALSYAQQARFNLRDALSAARKAMALKPGSALIHARIAQLLVALGDLDGAEATADRALRIDPADSNAHTVQGFVQLARLQPRAARANFERAVALDSADPLPRLGLGLTNMREGKVAEGREQIEIAVALDPYRALLRSYLGKAYFEENTIAREELARIQFDLAKTLDPRDPTPHYYNALLQQSRVNSLRAIEEVRAALEKNDYRGVVRGNLLLSEDLSVRAATIARMYQDIGLERPAQLSASDAVLVDSASADAHAFLADSYAYSPGLTAARESELLQSRLRSSMGLRTLYPLRPVQSSNAFISRAGPDLPQGPSRISMEEATRLFTANGIQASFEMFAGGFATDGIQASASVLQDHFGFALGVGSLQADRAGTSIDVSQDSVELAVQGRLSQRATLLGEVLWSDVQRSDTRRDFDESLARPMATRQDLERYRLGGRVELSPAADVLVSASRQQRDSTIVLLDTGSTSRPSQVGDVYEVQLHHGLDSFQALAGAGRAFTGSRTSPSARSLDATHENAYFYGTLVPEGMKVRLLAGVAWDNLDRSIENFRRKQYSPKFGLVWQPWQGGTLRAASIKAVKRELIAAQSLEPTQVAGFNQVYDDLNGSAYRRHGVGMDQWISRHFLFGMESSQRRLQVPVLALAGAEDFLWREKETRVYGYGIVPKLGSAAGSACSGLLGAEYRDRDFIRPEELPGSEGLRLLDSRRWIFTAAMQCSEFITLLLTPQRIMQTGVLQAVEGADLFSADENFWVIDASIQVRLPRRAGSVSIGVENLTDHQGGIGDRDPYAPSQTPGRQLFARVSIYF